MGEAVIFDFESRRLAIEWESMIEMMDTPTLLLRFPFDSSNTYLTQAFQRRKKKMREPVLQSIKILACRLNVIPSLNKNKIFTPCNVLMMLKEINALQTSLLSGLIKLYFT